MSTQFLMISRFPVKSGASRDFSSVLSEVKSRRTYSSIEGDEVMVLHALDADITLAELDDEFSKDLKDQARYLAGDVSREVLKFVEAPKAIDDLLPDTPYVQLRHVEVKPEAMAAYRKWRDETIFDVVRNAEEVETFLAYHSVVSGQPGVMFVSGFSTPPDTYADVFASERYQSIVQEAGDKYITGGTNGLYTKIYEDTRHRAA